MHRSFDAGLPPAPSGKEARRKLLQVDAHMLAKKITTRTVVGRSSSYVVPLTPAQAYDARDALSKAIYSNVFDWLISNLNQAMAGSDKAVRARQCCRCTLAVTTFFF